MISTINGDSNVPFYKELGNQGLKATDVPVVAFSVGEEELRGVDTKPLVGHLAAWNYFMSIKNPANDEFNKKWAAYAKAKKLPGADKPLTNDPMEATYIGIHMWKQAVEKAKRTDTDKVIAAMAGQTFKAPSRLHARRWTRRTTTCTSRCSSAKCKADGQFNVVWKTPGPVKAKPWSPYIAGNDKKKDEPGRSKSMQRTCAVGRAASASAAACAPRGACRPSARPDRTCGFLTSSGCCACSRGRALALLLHALRMPRRRARRRLARSASATTTRASRRSTALVAARRRRRAAVPPGAARRRA